MRDSLLLLALLYSSMALAEEVGSVEALPEGFLEFLGLMVEQDGELIDPLNMGNLKRMPESSVAATHEADPEAAVADADRTNAKKAEEHR